MNRNIFSLIIFLTLLIQPVGKSQGALFHTDLSSGLDLKYSDNVIYIYNFTTLATTTDSDFIYEPYLTFRLMKKDPIYSQKILLYFSYDAYSRYSELNYPTYSLLFEQGIGKQSYLTFKYVLNPYLFVGEEEVQGGQTGIDTGQNFRLQTFTLSFDKDLPQGFNLYLFGKEALKDFNTPIYYRTSISNTVGGDLTFRLKKMTTVLIGLSYEINESKKGTHIIGVNSFNDDSDYTSPAINFLGIHHLSSSDTARLKLVLKTRNYTADATDLLHGGRNDLITNLMISNNLKLTPKWSWRLAYELFKRDSNKPYADYTENSITTGIEYFF